MSNFIPDLVEVPNVQQQPVASVPVIRHLYTSASVNRRSGCISILAVNKKNGNSESLLAFGSSHAVCLAQLVRAEHGPTSDPSARSTTVPTFHISRVLHGHDAPINAVRWINLSNNVSENQLWPYALLLSLDTSGKVLVWCCHLDRLLDQGSGNDWSVLLSLQMPDPCATNAIDSCLIGNDAKSSADSFLLVVDVAADHTLYSWHVKIKGALGALPTIDDPVVLERKPSMCLCLRSFCFRMTEDHSPLFPQSSLHFILLGLDNGVIEIWSEHIKTTGQDLCSPRQLLHSATLVGHTDWVRCLDIALQPRVSIPTVFMASGGQDNIVRLWRIYNPDSQDPLTTEDRRRSTLKVADLRLPDTVKLNLSVASESVLSSHENWITGVSWELDMSSSQFPPALLSSSMDRSLIIWAPPNQQQTGAGDQVQLWLEQIRVGDVGGTGLGFLDCSWFISGTYRVILGQNFQSSLSLWTYEGDTGTWSPGLPLSGHSGPVADLTWSKTPSRACSAGIRETNSRGYRVLLTAGSDQTARAYAPRRLLATENDEVDGLRSPETCVWHELARPQVHGYDMNAIASLSPISYVSAGDEKVVRVFKATRAFLAAYEDSSGFAPQILDQSLAEGAVQPTLGLSNQVAAKGDVDCRPNGSDETAPSSLLTPLPTEDRLQHATLWPEVKKLYGHAYEVYCLAAHPHFMLVASASVATKPEYASIILWNGYADWTIHARLMHHQLTVTQLVWSHGGRSLLAVSRDRTWSVWTAMYSEQNNILENTDALPTYHLSAYPEKGKSHSRIIWTGAWSPDDRYFFTGSRDKTIMVWNAPNIPTDRPIAPVASVPLDIRKTFKDAVTALDMAELPSTQGSTGCSTAILAVGLESGQLQLFLVHSSSSSVTQLSWSEPIPFPAELCHVKNKRVRRVAFEPSPSPVSSIKPMIMTLATAADDGFVRLFEIDLEHSSLKL